MAGGMERQYTQAGTGVTWVSLRGSVVSLDMAMVPKIWVTTVDFVGGPRLYIYFRWPQQALVQP